MAKEFDKRKGPDYFQYRPAIQISNTNYESLVVCQSIIGYGHVSKCIRHSNPNSRLQYRYAVRNRETLLQVLEKIAAHLVVKKKQAEILQSYLSMRVATPFVRGWFKPYGTISDDMYQSLRFLNRVGKQAEVVHV